MKQAPLNIDFLRFRDQLKVRRQDGKTWLFDPIRQKYLQLLPEELVRQLVLLYLLEERGYNRNRISIEKGLKVNELSKRCDILVYDPEVRPFLLVECKAPEVPLSQDTFEQIAPLQSPPAGRLPDGHQRPPHLLLCPGLQTGKLPLPLRNPGVSEKQGLRELVLSFECVEKSRLHDHSKLNNSIIQKLSSKKTPCRCPGNCRWQNRSDR